MRLFTLLQGVNYPQQIMGDGYDAALVPAAYHQPPVLIPELALSLDSCIGQLAEQASDCFVPFAGSPTFSLPGAFIIARTDQPMMQFRTYQQTDSYHHQFQQ